jgi:hypothetical protein
MGILRGIGWAFLLIAVLVIVYGLVVWLGGVPIFEEAGGEHWYKVHPASLNRTQSITERYLHPALWDPLILNIVLWPVAAGLGLVSAVFAVPGILLVTLFRRRRRRLMR